MLVIFVAGGSCSGKTTLTKYLFKQLKERHINCNSIQLDDYYKEIPEGINFKIYKEQTNFDSPECLDLELLQEHILDLKRGKTIKKPVFDFKTERRCNFEQLASPDILILEGTASLYFAQHFLPHLSSTFKIFIGVHPDILLQRRINRDLIERTYVDEQSIIDKDIKFVRPTYIKLIEPTKHFADCLINNNESTYFNLDIVKLLENLTPVLNT